MGLKHIRDGVIAVDQGTYGEFELSYNPDDERIYVHDGDEVRATFAGNQKGLDNARYWARTHKRQH